MCLPPQGQRLNMPRGRRKSAEVKAHVERARDLFFRGRIAKEIASDLDVSISRAYRLLGYSGITKMFVTTEERTRILASRPILDGGAA